jgi:hypothetical protein
MRMLLMKRTLRIGSASGYHSTINELEWLWERPRVSFWRQWLAGVVFPKNRPRSSCEEPSPLRRDPKHSADPRHPHSLRQSGQWRHE